MAFYSKVASRNSFPGLAQEKETNDTFLYLSRSVSTITCRFESFVASGLRKGSSFQIKQNTLLDSRRRQEFITTTSCFSQDRRRNERIITTTSIDEKVIMQNHGIFS